MYGAANQINRCGTAIGVRVCKCTATIERTFYRTAQHVDRHTATNISLQATAEDVVTDCSVLDVHYRTACIVGLVACTIDIAQVVVTAGRGICPVDIHFNVATDIAAGIVTAKDTLNATASDQERDIASDVCCIGTAIDVADAFAFCTRAADGHVAGITGRHITAAINLVDVHGARTCLVDQHIDGAAYRASSIGTTIHTADGATIYLNIGVARYVGCRHRTITTAKDIAYLVAAIDGHVGIAVGDVGSITATIDIANAVVAVIDSYGRCAVTIVSPITAAIDSIQCIGAFTRSRVCSIDDDNDCPLRSTIDVVTAIDST